MKVKEMGVEPGRFRVFKHRKTGANGIITDKLDRIG